MNGYKHILTGLFVTLCSLPSLAQGIRRSNISFYASSSLTVKASTAQLLPGFFSSQNVSGLFGFQQPLENKVDVGLNMGSDTTFCANDSFLLRVNRSFSYKWYKNDTLLLGEVGNTLKIKSPGIYKCVGYDGIIRFDTSKRVNVSYKTKPIKPVIGTFGLDSFSCFNDSVRLQASLGYDKYLWSNGDSTSSILVTKSGTYRLLTAERIISTGGFCYSDSSDMVLIRKNNTAIPSISRVGDLLLSSSALKYKWYYNYRDLPIDSAMQMAIRYKGVYSVRTSIDGYCWSSSPVYLVQTDPIQNVLNDFSVSAFPNPFTSLFYLQINLGKKYSGKIQLTILDATGNVRWVGSKYIFNEKTFKIPVSITLPKGVYAVQILLNGYNRKTIQVIRN